jgi:hypothetical protein
MAYGFDRFLTTHTGSLPRLVRAMFAKEEGVPAAVRLFERCGGSP